MTLPLHQDLGYGSGRIQTTVPIIHTSLLELKVNNTYMHVKDIRACLFQFEVVLPYFIVMLTKQTKKNK